MVRCFVIELNVQCMLLSYCAKLCSSNGLGVLFGIVHVRLRHDSLRMKVWMGQSRPGYGLHMKQNLYMCLLMLYNKHILIVIGIL